MASVGATASLGRRDQAVVFLISIGHGVTHWMHAVIFILLPLIRQEFGLSYTEIGLFGTVYYAGATVANVTGGPIADLTGRRTLLLVLALIIMSTAMLGFGTTSQYWMLTAMAVMVAFANSLWHPAAIPYLATRYSTHRGYVMSIHGMMSNLGDSVAPAVIGAMVSGWLVYQFTWREAAMLSALPGIVMLPLFVMLLIRSNGYGSGGGGSGMNLVSYLRSIGAQLRNRAVLAIALMAGLRSTAQSGLKFFLPLYIVDLLGMDLALAGLAVAVLNIGGSLAAVPAGVASDRFGRAPVTKVALALSTVFIGGIALLQDEVSLVVGISLAGFSLYALRPVMLSWMMDIVPSELRGSGTGLMFTTQSAFNIASPAIAGAIADQYGLVNVFFFLAAMLIIANIVAFMLPRDAEAARAEH